MFFVLIMTSSLSADFDPYYLSFLIGYIGLRAVTAIQYLIVQRIEAGVRKQGAQDIFGLESLFHYYPSFLILGFDMLCCIWEFLSILLSHCLEESV